MSYDQQASYAAPGHQPQRRPVSGPSVAFGLTAVVLGIIATVTLWLPFFSQLVAGVGLTIGAIGVLLGFRRRGSWVAFAGTSTSLFPLALTVMAIVGLMSLPNGGRAVAPRGPNSIARNDNNLIPPPNSSLKLSGSSQDLDGTRGASAPPAIVSTSSPPRVRTLDDEARHVVVEDLNRHWTQIGNSFVALARRPGFDGANDWGDDFYIEKKGVEPILEADQLSDADRLNGIAWKGRACFVERAGREYFFRDRTSLMPLRKEQKGWTQWRSPGDPALESRGFWRVSLEKRSGSWQVTANGFDENAYFPVQGRDAQDSHTAFDPVEDYFGRKLAAAKASLHQGQLAVAMKDGQTALSLKPTDGNAVAVLDEIQIALLKNWRAADQNLLLQAAQGVVQRREKAAVPILLEAMKAKYDGKVREPGRQPFTIFAWALAQLGAKDAEPVIVTALSNSINSEAPSGTLDSVNAFLAALEVLDGPSWRGFAVWAGGWTEFYNIVGGVEKVKDRGGSVAPGKGIDETARGKLTQVLQKLGPADLLGGSRTGLNISNDQPLVTVRGPEAVDLYLTITSGGRGGPTPVGGFVLSLRATSEHAWVVADVKDPVVNGQPFVRFGDAAAAPEPAKPVATRPTGSGAVANEIAIGAGFPGHPPQAPVPQPLPIAARPKALANGTVRFTAPDGWDELPSTESRAAYALHDHRSILSVDVAPADSKIGPDSSIGIIRDLRQRRLQRKEQYLLNPTVEKDGRFLLRIHEKYHMIVKVDGRPTEKIADQLHLYCQVGPRLVMVTVWSMADSDDDLKQAASAGEHIALSASFARP